MTQATTESELDPRHPLVRLGAFFDGGEFTTITPVDDRGVIAAVGRANGTHVVAFATDPTVQGGAMGSAGCKVILTAYSRALADSTPVVGLWHSGGARLREGVASLHAVGEVFAIMTRASGRGPQISVTRAAVFSRPGVDSSPAPSLASSWTGWSSPRGPPPWRRRGSAVTCGSCGRASC